MVWHTALYIYYIDVYVLATHSYACTRIALHTEYVAACICVCIEAMGRACVGEALCCMDRAKLFFSRFVFILLFLCGAVLFLLCVFMGTWRVHRYTRTHAPRLCAWNE